MNSELKKGIATESEHSDTIEQIIEDVKAGKVRALKEYFQMIAQDHLEEMSDYYTQLAKMEKQKQPPKAIALIAIAKKPKE